MQSVLQFRTTSCRLSSRKHVDRRVFQSTSGRSIQAFRKAFVAAAASVAAEEEVLTETIDTNEVFAEATQQKEQAPKRSSQDSRKSSDKVVISPKTKIPVAGGRIAKQLRTKGTVTVRGNTPEVSHTVMKSLAVANRYLMEEGKCVVLLKLQQQERPDGSSVLVVDAGMAVSQELEAGTPVNVSATVAVETVRHRIVAKVANYEPVAVQAAGKVAIDTATLSIISAQARLAQLGYEIGLVPTMKGENVRGSKGRGSVSVAKRGAKNVTAAVAAAAAATLVEAGGEVEAVAAGTESTEAGTPGTEAVTDASAAVGAGTETDSASASTSTPSTVGDTAGDTTAAGTAADAAGSEATSSSGSSADGGAGADGSKARQHYGGFLQLNVVLLATSPSQPPPPPAGDAKPGRPQDEKAVSNLFTEADERLANSEESGPAPRVLFQVTADVDADSLKGQLVQELRRANVAQLAFAAADSSTAIKALASVSSFLSSSVLVSPSSLRCTIATSSRDGSYIVDLTREAPPTPEDAPPENLLENPIRVASTSDPAAVANALFLRSKQEGWAAMRFTIGKNAATSMAALVAARDRLQAEMKDFSFTLVIERVQVKETFVRMACVVIRPQSLEV